MVSYKSKRNCKKLFKKNPQMRLNSPHNYSEKGFTAGYESSPNYNSSRMILMGSR